MKVVTLPEMQKGDWAITHFTIDRVCFRNLMSGRGIVESLAVEEMRSIRQDYLDEKEAEEAEEVAMQQMKTRGHDRWNVI